MNEQALLEKAAKANGITWTSYDKDRGLCINGPMNLVKGTCWWNPLKDPGDALRLAVWLELDLKYFRYNFEKRMELVCSGIVSDAIRFGKCK